MLGDAVPCVPDEVAVEGLQAGPTVRDAKPAACAAAAAAAAQGTPDGSSRREHGHHGHLRTRRAVEGLEVDGSGSGHDGSGSEPGSSSKPRQHRQQQEEAGEPSTRPRHTGASHAGNGSGAAAPTTAKLSFADELQEDGGGDEGGGGLRAATAGRFRAEKRAAAVAASYHAFHARNGPGAGPGSGSGSGSDAEAGERRVRRRPGVALVDDDSGDERRRASGARARGSLGHVYFGSATARGMRPYQEDRHCVVAAMQLLSSAAGGGATPGAPLPPDGVPRSYAAIFDGHNGAGAAELAAARLHVLLAANPSLRTHTGELAPPAVVRQEEAAIAAALRSAFAVVDEATLAVSRREGVRDGATALVALRLGQVLYVAHAGDSRAVLCRDGAALRLTEDHKPHLPRERARIEDAGGRVDFQRCWRVVVEPRDGRPGSGLAVSRSLGDLDFKEPAKFVECEPDVLRVALRPLQPSGAGDAFIILGSDGLWDVLSDEDAVHCAKNAMQEHRAEHHSGRHDNDAQAKAIADALLAEAMRRGTMDNTTVLCMLLAWSE